MKKIFLIMVSCVMAVVSMAQNPTVTIPNISVCQGGFGFIPLNLVSDIDIDYYQLDLMLPDGISIVGYAQGDIAVDHVTQYAHDTDGTKGFGTVGEWRALATSGTASVYTAHTGVMAYLKIQHTGSQAVGAVLNATFEDVEVGCAGVPYKSLTGTPSAFTITIADGYTLDENSTWPGLTTDETDNDGDGMADNPVKIIVNRTIKKNVWSTICLPFNMDAEMIKTVFGNDAEQAVFGTDYIADGCCVHATANSASVDNIQIDFVSYTGDDMFIMANTPCLIKSTKDPFTSFTVNSGLVAHETTPVAELYDQLRKMDVTTKWSTVANQRKRSYFYGNYNPSTVLEDNALYLSDNKYYYSNGATVIKGFRGYFVLFPVLSNKDTSVKEITFSVGGIEITDGIEGLTEDGVAAEGWYDLNGRKLNNKPAAKGIYINNGKKVVIK